RAGAEAADLRACLDNEAALGEWITARPDFAEGIRAAVVDKDHSPTCGPADLDSADADGIRSALTASCAGPPGLRCARPEVRCECVRDPWGCAGGLGHTRSASRG